MKKLGFAFLISILFAASLFSLEVDEKELKSTDTTIEFINYTGPHKVIDSISAIKSIGSELGKIVSDDPSKSTTAGTQNRYRVVHAVDANESGKLDADIIYIGKDARVDHVDNLRRIISAYLSSAYGYSESDANTIAVFITVYNAVYRGKIDSYSSKYKKVVTDNLSASNCGLSVNYHDWPGQSEIVIPLYDVNNGGLSTVDTSVISDSKVVESMKEDDDRNVESRKEMVDIKEREADNATQKAQEAQKQAVTEQKKANQAKEEAKEAQKTAEEKQKIAEENPDDKNAQKEAEEAKQEAEEKEVEAQQAQETADQARETASEQQAQADKKQTEAQSERKEIAQDQNEIQKEEAEKARMPSEYGLIICDETTLLSKLVIFNKDNGEIIQNSPVNVIHNRTVYKGSENYIAIAGENINNGAVKLVTIDPKTLEINGETELVVADSSALVQNASEYVCVVVDNEKYYLAKFGEDLSLLAKSEIEVKPNTPITLTSSGYVITDFEGKLRVLNSTTLVSETK